MICASFDIGIKNFSFYVEEFDESDFPEIADIKSLYNPDGTAMEELTPDLNSIYKNGRVVLLENIDISSSPGDSTLSPQVFVNMTRVLNSHADTWAGCEFIVIEQQMMFGKATNPSAVKLGQHCFSYFSIKYGLDKHIVEFPAYHKTQILGAAKEFNGVTKTGKPRYKTQSKPKRKKWCTAKALDILLLRGDDSTSTRIKEMRKKDDVCDVICQLQSWKIINNYI